MLLSRKKLLPLIAELIGTFILTFIVLSVSKSNIGLAYFVSLAVGLTLAVLVLVIGNTSGCHINPAVTFGLWSVKKISTIKALLYVVAQFMGALFAWKLYTYFIADVIPNIATKEFDWRIFVAELVGTLVFTFGLAAAIYQDQTDSKKAFVIGSSLTLGILVASAVSNGVLNPAVALGIQSWSREYAIAPLVGGFFGVNLYSLVFAGESFSIKKRSKYVSVPSKVTIESSKKSNKKTTKNKK